MKRLYITFGGLAYDQTTERIVEDAPLLGADEVRVYDDAWLMGQPFYTLNHWLWETPGTRGFGWFAWKPFIILDALERYCQPGDVLLYTDADTYPIHDLRPLYERAYEEGAMFFQAQGCSNRAFVKHDCRVVMGQMQERPEWMPAAAPNDSQHATARFILIQAGDWKAKQFLIEWLTYCLNPFATTFERSSIFFGECESVGFQEHRTEQAILSLLVHKYGYHLYREACQFGNAALEKFGEDAWYPQTFVQVYASGPRALNGSRFANVE